MIATILMLFSAAVMPPHTCQRVSAKSMEHKHVALIRIHDLYGHDVECFSDHTFAVERHDPNFKDGIMVYPEAQTGDLIVSHVFARTGGGVQINFLRTKGYIGPMLAIQTVTKKAHYCAVPDDPEQFAATKAKGSNITSVPGHIERCK